MLSVACETGFLVNEYLFHMVRTMMVERMLRSGPSSVRLVWLIPRII